MSNRAPISVTASLGCAVVLGCSGERRAAGGPEWQAAVDTVGDTVVVRTQSGSVWGDTSRLVPEVTIGELEGADEYMFGRIASLAVAPDGSIYVFDSHAKALRKYAPDGTYLATFGRPGGGPGEYRRPDGGLAVLSDGRVLLRDPANARITVYSAEGKTLDGWRIRGNFNFSRRLYVDTAGNAYTTILLNPESDVTDWKLGLVRVRPDGQPADTLPAPTWDAEESRLVARFEDEDNSSFNSTEVPFTPTAAWSVSPLGYLVGGISTRYAFNLYLAPDRVLRIERSNWQPVPVKPEERAEHERITTASMRQVDPGWRWNGPPIPGAKPPYLGFFVGEEGRIWVVLHQEAHQVEVEDEPGADVKPGRIPPQTWIESVAFDVFEPDGRYLGMVRAPDGFSIRPEPVARADTVWAVVRGDFEVPYVVRLRVEHGPPGHLRRVTGGTRRDGSTPT